MATMILPAAAAPAWPEAHSGAYLGVQMKVVTPERASVLKLKESSGAVITYVDQDGPACRAGLMENDVIVGFNGAKVDNPGQLQGLIHTSTPEKPVTLTIVRNGERKDVKVTLGSWSTMSRIAAKSQSVHATTGGAIRPSAARRQTTANRASSSASAQITAPATNRKISIEPVSAASWPRRVRRR